MHIDSIIDSVKKSPLYSKAEIKKYFGDIE